MFLFAEAPGLGCASFLNGVLKFVALLERGIGTGTRNQLKTAF
jgi:hypothetical protein